MNAALVPAILSLLLLAAAWGLRWAGASVTLAAILAAAVGLAGVGVMLAVSRIKGVMAHCAAYCPLGAMAAILGRINPFRVAMSQDCTGCGLCSRACRYDALRPTDLAPRRPGASCTLCGDCVGACPHSAMGYRFPLLSPASARILFLILAVALHAAFMGLARI